VLCHFNGCRRWFGLRGQRARSWGCLEIIRAYPGRHSSQTGALGRKLVRVLTNSWTIRYLQGKWMIGAVMWLARQINFKVHPSDFGVRRILSSLPHVRYPPQTLTPPWRMGRLQILSDTWRLNQGTRKLRGNLAQQGKAYLYMCHTLKLTIETSNDGNGLMDHYEGSVMNPIGHWPIPWPLWYRKFSVSPYMRLIFH
jgi:hypothetical protein